MKRDLGRAKVSLFLSGSSNGRTSGFGPENRGSNPSMFTVIAKNDTVKLKKNPFLGNA